MQRHKTGTSNEHKTIKEKKKKVCKNSISKESESVLKRIAIQSGFKN